MGLALCLEAESLPAELKVEEAGSIRLLSDPEETRHPCHVTRITIVILTIDSGHEAKFVAGVIMEICMREWDMLKHPIPRPRIC